MRMAEVSHMLPLKKKLSELLELLLENSIVESNFGSSLVIVHI